MKFDFGAIHYGGTLRDERFLDDCLVKFQRNYWGCAEKSQWKTNKVALADEKGEIRGAYKNEEGLVLHVIHIFADNSKDTILCMQSDLDNGFYENSLEKIKARQESRGAKGKRGMLKFNTNLWA